MTLAELKKCITNKTVPSEFMIFVKRDNHFLAKQYLDSLTRLMDGGFVKINSIYEPQNSSLLLLTASEPVLNVMTVDTFDERADDYTIFEHTIVVCDQVDKSIAKNVEEFVVTFPVLEEWQVLDYAKTLCKSVDESDLLWLIRATGNDLTRITNELEKVNCFSGDAQKEVFASIRFDPQTDLIKFDLFKTANALIDGNLTYLYDFIIHNGYAQLEPVVLANRALTSLKNIALITQNPGLTPEACGVSQKQFMKLRYMYTSLNMQAVQNKIKFLTNFDLDLKTSKLEMSKRDMMNYLISNLGYKITK